MTPRRRSLLGASLVALVCAASLLFALPARATLPADDQATFYSLTNLTRSQNGLAALTPDVLAARVAQAWADHMAATMSLVHNPNLASDINTYVTTDWQRIGENIGYGGSASSIQTAFLNSPPHRANIVGDYNRVGIGTARDSRGVLWVTVDFVKGPPIATVDPATFRPFDSAEQLVAQQYVDILGRPADSGGLATWANELDSGRVSPGALVQTFIQSPEFQSVVAPIARFYFSALNRIPDYSGLTYWLGTVRNGKPLGDIAAYFASSPEFTAKYGALAPTQFVNQMYLNVLHRPADTGGLTYWVNLLVNGTLNRGGVLSGFSESQEFVQATWSQVATTSAYICLLRRTPDQSGFTYWATQMQGGTPIAVVMASMIASPEYAKRFGG